MSWCVAGVPRSSMRARCRSATIASARSAWSSAPAAVRRFPRSTGSTTCRYLTNETIFELREQPRRLLVLGAGAVGLELAQAFVRLGTEVDVVDDARHFSRARTRRSRR